MILDYDPKEGLHVSDPIQRDMLLKYCYWTKGIPVYQYYKEKISDINIIMSLNEAFNEKKLKEAEIQSLINQAQSMQKW